MVRVELGPVPFQPKHCTAIGQSRPHREIGNALGYTCDGRRENAALAGGRRSVRKRSAHSLTHGLGTTMVQ